MRRIALAPACSEHDLSPITSGPTRRNARASCSIAAGRDVAFESPGRTRAEDVIVARATRFSEEVDKWLWFQNLCFPGFSRLFARGGCPADRLARFSSKSCSRSSEFDAPSACLSRSSSEPRPEAASGTMAAAGGIHALTYLEKYVESAYLSPVTPA